MSNKAQSTESEAPEVAELAQAFDAGMSLEDALDYDFAGWKPAEGEKLTGTVVYTTVTDGGHPEYGEYPLVAVISTTGELVAVHAFHTNLRNEIDRQRPQQGDRIGIKYKGRKTEGGAMGTGYEAYNVIVQHTTGTPALAGSTQSALPE